MTKYFFEDFKVGDKIVTRTRFITSSEIEHIAALIGATNPLFLNSEEAQRKGFKRKITPGVVIEAYAFGLEYQTGIYDNIIALLEVDKMIFKAPLLHGDPLRSEIEVICKEETSRPDRGIIIFHRKCFVGEKKIMEAKLKFLYLKEHR